MESEDRSEARDTEEQASVEVTDCEADETDEDIQRCIRGPRGSSEAGPEPSRLRVLEARIGDLLTNPFVALMSQVALELEVLV